MTSAYLKLNHWFAFLHRKIVNSFMQQKSWLVILPAYAWLGLFFLIPFLLIVKISLSNAIIGMPPYSAIFEWVQPYLLKIQINFSNYKMLLSDDIYLSTFVSSLSVAGLSACVCLVLGFMMAYGISKTPKRMRLLCLFLIILPFWTSFLIRVYGWMSLLSATGMINQLLMKLGLISSPLLMLGNTYAVCIGIVYCYLPFMVLPIYTSLQKIDSTLIEVSYDLGATPWMTFWRIIVPSAMPGIIAGFVLVFVPAVGEFVIPELLGGPDTLMIGRTLWSEFFNNRDWPQACALAVSIIVVVVVPLMLFQVDKHTK